MNQLLLETEKPPSPEGSFLDELFGYGTPPYWAFLEALLDGLIEYETKNGGAIHAPEPLPAA